MGIKMGRENLKRILLIATGGTIASGYTEKGLAPKIAAEDLLQYVEGYQEFCQVDARTNLFDSLLFASEPKAHGVNIVFGGKVIKEDFHLMEAYDMTLEATVTKP